MKQEVEALLALQQDDLKIREIEKQLRSLDPQLADFDRKREQAAAALARAQAAVQVEEKSSASSKVGSRNTKSSRSGISISSRM